MNPHTPNPDSTIIKILPQFFYVLMSILKQIKTSCQFTLNYSICVPAKYGHFITYYTTVISIKKNSTE